MKTADIINIIEDEDTYSLIEAALKEADKQSYENPAFCYCVAVYADGTIKIREHYGNENARYFHDEAIAVIGSISREFWTLSDWYDDRETLLHDLKETLQDFPDDARSYLKYLDGQDYSEWTRGEIVDAEIDWIHSHAVETWLALERYAINELTNESEFDGQYRAIIDEYIKMLKATKEED